jgi:CheY-like chemotaxis protein
MMERPKVFYVDDNDRTRATLTRMLEASGFEVISLGHPGHALGVLKDASVDVVLVDYQMPEFTGAQLAREIKALDRPLPVIVISGMEELPSNEMKYVDVHFGRGTRLDDLVDTLRDLAALKSCMLRFSARVGFGAALTDPWADAEPVPDDWSGLLHQG